MVAHFMVASLWMLRDNNISSIPPWSDSFMKIGVEIFV